jgi:hypothetical protein
MEAVDNIQYQLNNPEYVTGICHIFVYKMPQATKSLGHGRQFNEILLWKLYNLADDVR